MRNGTLHACCQLRCACLERRLHSHDEDVPAARYQIPLCARVDQLALRQRNVALGANRDDQMLCALLVGEAEPTV